MRAPVRQFAGSYFRLLTASMRLLAKMRDWVRRLRAPQPLGRQGEAAAARFLKRLGYVLVARGHRDRLGELDLIAVDGRTVVFVEVKTRRSHEAGHPTESVDQNKQRRLTRLALAYLKRHDLLEHSARFDVVAVTWPEDQRKPAIEHYINAFEPVGQGQMFS